MGVKRVTRAIIAAFLVQSYCNLAFQKLNLCFVSQSLLCLKHKA